MQDIEFLQYFGGMNPGERFFKIAPHLKPEPPKETKEEEEDDDSRRSA